MKRVSLCEWTLMLALGLSLCISPAADADVVGAWLFNEGSGSSAGDSSGNGLTGTIKGNPQWVAEDEAMFGSALRFAEGDYVDFGPPTPAAFLVEQDISFMVWCKPRQLVSHWQVVFSMQRGSSGGEAYAMTYGYNDDQLRAIVNTAGGNAEPLDPTPFVLNEWIHAAATYDGDKVILYRNGQPVAENSANVSGALNHGDRAGRFAINGNYNSLNGGLGEYAVCTLDEVVIFDEALSQEQIQGIMELGFLAWRSGPGSATDPTPKDGATDIPRDVVLSWTAGEFAGTHDVYLGTSFADVNTAGRSNPANVLASQGQNDTTYDSGGLPGFNQTYYWRVDEVNAPPDATIYKGRVWSFTTEPYAYLLPTATATASSSAKDMGPEKTVNGSGLNAGGQHSSVDTDMWLSAPATPLPAWIRFEFDQIRKLDEMRVWNSNQKVEPYIGFGAKNVTIEYSLDGTEWSKLSDVELARADGTNTYTGMAIDLAGIQAKFVRLTIHSSWSGFIPQAGLSEVRFSYIPVRAREPQPAAGATDVAVDSVLSWRAGREAVSHEVCLSTDQQAVADGTAPIVKVTESRFTPDDMEYGRVYYWKVNEVNEAATPSRWEGDVWSFTTAQYAVIDDFESYNDKENAGTRIYETWIDGWDNPANNGGVVGYSAPPFAERSIVHGGAQSMPLTYDNTGTATISEATRTFDATQDWTAGGIRSLSLWFYGDPGNAGQLYVRINNTKVAYDGDAADLKRRQWQPWNIDLSAVGGSVSNVTKVTIGIEGAGVKGVLYIDDIRLYPRTPEYLTPTEPGVNGLLAQYLFDNGANDSSGNGHHGTFLGNAQAAGGLLVLDGVDDAVAIPRLGGATATFPQCTYSMWMYSIPEPASAGIIGGINFDNWSAGGIHCKLYNGRANAGIYGLAGGDLNGTTIVRAEEWVHLALTVSDTVATIYLNGQPEASRAFSTPLAMALGAGCIGAWNSNNDIQRELEGQMNDVSVYDRALSVEELLWLAGRRTPVAKPF